MIPATPGILFQSVVWLPSGTFVELLTRKVKDFSLFQEALIVQRIKQRILEKGWAKIFTKKVVTLFLFSALKKIQQDYSSQPPKEYLLHFYFIFLDSTIISTSESSSLFLDKLSSLTRTNLHNYITMQVLVNPFPSLYLQYSNILWFVND